MAIPVLGNTKIMTNEEVMKNPVAKSLTDLVTTKQLGMIRAVARYEGVNADEVCLENLKCNVGELSKRGASLLIELLQTKDHQ